MAQLFQTLLDLGGNLLQLVGELVRIGLHYWLLLVWIAWWLGAVNWQRAWPFLARGAWVPLVLIVFMAAAVWARVSPREFTLIEGVTYIPNFWWQLVAVSLLTGTALFLGWLQGVFGWTPPEINLEPPAVEHAAEHGHAH